MSDTEPQKPSSKTSTVPLKKETVRITLRARPEETGPVAPKGSTAPVPSADWDNTAPLTPTAAVPTAAPSAPAPPVPPSAPAPPAPPAPMAPPTPSAASVDERGPTRPVPVKPAAPTAPVGAKTIPLAAAPAAPIGAKTIPLAKAPTPGGAPPVGKATVPLTPAKPLPQATMKLQNVQSIGTTTSEIGKTPNIKSTAVEEEEEWEEEYEESGLTLFSVVALVLALVVMGVQFWTYTIANG